jgi:hypothetical protein
MGAAGSAQGARHSHGGAGGRHCGGGWGATAADWRPRRRVARMGFAAVQLRQGATSARWISRCRCVKPSRTDHASGAISVRAIFPTSLWDGSLIAGQGRRAFARTPPRRPFDARLVVQLFGCIWVYCNAPLRGHCRQAHPGVSSSTSTTAGAFRRGQARATARRRAGGHPGVRSGECGGHGGRGRPAASAGPARIVGAALYPQRALRLHLYGSLPSLPNRRVKLALCIVWCLLVPVRSP